MFCAVRQLFGLLLLALVPALVSAAIQLQWKGDEPLQPGEVRAATARQWADQVLWVDARPRARFDAGHIGGAISLEAGEWEAQVPAFFAAWSADKTVVVYGDSAAPAVSRDLAARLHGHLKIEPVYVLKGGFEAWRP
jgi:rhodanese-related sulfurtransferase